MSIRTPNQKMIGLKSSMNRMTPSSVLNYLKPTVTASTSSKRHSMQYKHPFASNENVYAVEGKIAKKSTNIGGDLTVPSMHVSGSEAASFRII